jgi:hypothetical protein
MFNTCSRGPAHQPLTNTGGGYNLGGAGLPHTTPRPSQPVVSTFNLRAPPGLQFNQVLSKKQSVEFKNLWPPCGLPTTRPSTVPTSMPSHSKRPISSNKGHKDRLEVIIKQLGYQINSYNLMHIQES